MDFGSPEGVKDFPGLYGMEPDLESDPEAKGSKQLIGKRKDKKEKDISYGPLGESSGDEDTDGKSPLKGKKSNPFKFSKKDKREKEKPKEHKEKEKPKDHKEKESKARDIKEKDLKVKENKERLKEEKVREKNKEEKSKDKSKEEKLKDKERQKEEKWKDKERIKEKSKDKAKDDKVKEKVVKENKETRDVSKGKNDEHKKKKKKDKKEGKELKKSDPGEVVEEEPIFGVPLSVAVERSKCHDGVPLPAVVRECIDYIEQNGLNCEGIYRLSGVKSKVQQLRKSYNIREVVLLWHHEPHTVASLLKLFLRELPEPVLTAELLPEFDAAAGMKDPEKRVSQLRQLLDSLPDPNRLLVQYIFKHMEHIIKREKINKMNVQNVSLVLSPTMQISHRVLNAFFLYGKILFAGVTIKKYVPPLSEGEEPLPDTADAIAEEIAKQESLLSQLHSELKAGSISRRREEQLWQAQRILTQLKRRQRQVRKPSDADAGRKPCELESTGGSGGAASEPASSSEGGGCAAVAAASPQRLDRTVQIISEDNVTVIQIGEKRTQAATAGAAESEQAGPSEETVADEDPSAKAEKTPATDDTSSVASSLPQPAGEPADVGSPSEDGSADAVDRAASADTSETATSPDAAPADGQVVPPYTLEAAHHSENQASFSDLHRRARPPPLTIHTVAADAGLATAASSATPDGPEELSETAALLRQVIFIMLEEEELKSTERELRNRLAAERGEIERLKDTIQEMETLYKYRTYSVDSSDDSSGAESDDSDTEEELLKTLQDIMRHNEQIEAKNAQLTRAVHEERRKCQKIRAQIRYTEMLNSGRA